MHRLSRVVIIGVLAVAVGALAAGPATAAKGGNSDSAKACQHGGWKTLVPAGGGTFANQGDCVNDGAQGRPPLLGSAGQAACADVGGSFRTQKGGGAWSCSYTANPPPDPPGDPNTLALQAACATDGGNFAIEDDPPFTVATCQ
jgi:hypothetical protein